MPDKDGYPTDEELEKIKELGRECFGSGRIYALLDHLEQIWWMPDWGFVRKPIQGCRRRRILRVEMHTAGWSGNEEIINELQGTDFWHFYWARSDRGGHYYFDINIGSEG